MKFCYNIISIFIFIFTTLTLYTLFTTPNLHISPSTNRILLVFKNSRKPHVNLSPTPSPSPSPLPLPSGAPVHRVHKHSRHHLPPLPPLKENDGGKRRRVLVAALVAAGAVTCFIFLIGVFLLLRKVRTRKKNMLVENVKKVTSDPVQKNFYLESLGRVLDPPSVCSIKQDSGDQNLATQDVELNKFDDEDEHVFYGSPIAEEIIHSSDDESFHSICNSIVSENPRISDASTGCDALELQRTSNASMSRDVLELKRVSNASMSQDLLELKRVSNASMSCDALELKRVSDATSSFDASEPRASAPSPPPPPPPPPPFTSPPTKFKPKTVTFQTKSDESYNATNKSLVPPPPLPPPFPKGSPLLPPPPFTKGGPLLPPPPPPPSQSMLTGKDGTPLPKLKPLHWDKVRAGSDRSMVWDKLRSSSFEFDEEMIESLFSYNLHNPNEELKSKSPSPSKHVLEPKRLQNLTILLKALNVTAEQVCCALVQGNGLNLQQLEVLIKMEPTKEEETKLTEYKGDMGSAERFVATLLSVPKAFPRIEALLYRETFEDEMTHLRKTFSVLEEACKELRSSRLFLKLLEAVLKTGNRMNVGTIRGGAKAFKLDTLLKLADVKGTDGKTTLLHFVVQEIVRSEGVRVSESIIGMINQKGQQRNIQEKEEDYRNMGLELVAGLTTELCNVKKTATIDFDVIASSVSNLSNGMRRLEQLVNEELSLKDKKSCSFGQSMKSFVKYADKHLKELEKDEHKVLELVKEVTEYFHGNMSRDDANPLRIFVTVRDFLAMLDLVCRELRRSKVFSHPSPLAPFQ